MWTDACARRGVDVLVERGQVMGVRIGVVNRRVAQGSRVEIVRRWFGLEQGAPWRPAVPEQLPMPAAGQVLLITGASGSGKSSLLGAYRRRLGADVIDLAAVRLGRGAVVDVLDDVPLDHGLRLLARVGLADAHSYVLPAHRLSAGQRWRLGLALAMHRCAKPRRLVTLVCDEFAAVLDRVTAAVICALVRRFVSGRRGLRAIVATGHDDVRAWLRPDLVAECDFGLVRWSGSGLRRDKEADQ